MTFAIAALTAGSAHAEDIVYSSEDFEGGTPNYEVAGAAAPYSLIQLEGITSQTALTGTDYTPGSPSRSGIFANGNLPGTIVDEPTGQHGFVSQSQNRRLDLTNGMTLVADGVATLNITFKILLYAFEDGERSPDFDDTAAVFYSASGDFTDSVQIATCATENMAEPVVFPDEPDSILGHTTVVEDTWSTVSLSLSSTDVTFTDTAKIRFNKLPSTGTNLLVFVDDITLTGITSTIVYSSEDFEGGTPNYEVAGAAAPYSLIQLEGITSQTALTGTDYTPQSPSRSGIFANGNLPGTIVDEPTGQHGFVSQSQNRRLTLTNGMPLVADGVDTLNITFKTLLYAFEDGERSPDFDDTAAVFYSALGDFTDSVQIATYATENMAEPVVFPDEPDSILGHSTLVEDTWSTLSLSLSSTDVTFTDTARIRFNKLPSTGTNLLVFVDDITVTGIQGAPPALPLAMTIAPAVSPDSGYDLEWTSQAGMTYSLLTSTDLSSPVDSWTVVQAEITPTPPLNSYNLPADGSRRFYVIKETPAAP